MIEQTPKFMKQYHRQTFILFLSMIFLFPPLTQAQKWVQMGKNIAGKENMESLGSSVSLSADGKTLAAGAEGRAGHIKVYTWNGEGNWVQKGSTIENEGDRTADGLGQVVSLSADGNVFVCGTPKKTISYGIPNEGQVKVYAWNGTDWVQKGKAINGSTSHPSNRYVGSSISLSEDGNTLVMNGRKYMSIYTWDGQSWVETLSKKVSYDEAVSISSDGKTVAMAARFKDESGQMTPYQVLILEWNGTEWVQKGNDITSNKSDDSVPFGTALSLSANGESLVVGYPDFPEIYYTRVYEWNGSDWVQKGEDIVTTEEISGYAVSIAGDGNTIATGGEDFVFVYAWDGQEWELIHEAIPSNSSYHELATISLSADGSIIAIGSPYDQKNKKAILGGIVRVYQLED